MRPPGDRGEAEFRSTVLVLMRAGRDRELLVTELESVPRYEVVAAESVPADLEYDLCLADEATFEREREALLARKRAEKPTFLPHALVRPGSADRADPPENEVVEGVGAPIDRVFELPLRKAPFHRGIETLLYARRSAVRLAEREVQYHRLLELAPEAILLVADGEVRYGNRAAVDLFGRPEGELPGTDATSLVADGDRERFAALLAGVSVDEPATPFEEFEVHAAEGAAPASIAGVGVHYDGAETCQLLIRDLRERKRRERRIDLLRRGIDAADQGITIADARADDEPLIYASAGFERITGYSVDEITGRNCRFLQGEGTSEETVAKLRRAIDRGEQITVELLNYRADGTPFWNQLDIVPVRDSSGVVTHFLGLQRDVTERKLREQRLAVLNRVLRHNLRNKLGVVRGYAQRAVEGEGLDPTEAERVLRAADELLEISEQVQRFGDAVDLPGQATTPTELAGLLADAVAEARGAETGAIAVDCPEGVTVWAHRTLTASVGHLFGLLVGATAGAVPVSVRTDGAHAWVEVVDRGGVFDDVDLRVIERGTETPLEHLQGVELWLVKWAVEQSGGEVDVDRSGDEVSVRLKLRVADGDGGELSADGEHEG